MSGWDGIDGINVGNREGGEGDAHARAPVDSQEDPKDVNKEEVVLGETVEVYLAYKKIPEFIIMHKDGEACAKMTYEKAVAPT